MQDTQEKALKEGRTQDTPSPAAGEDQLVAVCEVVLQESRDDLLHDDAAQERPLP